MARDRVPPALREEVQKRAAGRCEYCRFREDLGAGPFNAEHIIPQAKEGATSLENLAWSCHGCNGHKAAKVEGWDRAGQRSAPLFHPRTQRWSEHFAWSDDATMVVGTTATGRATVEALQLNRLGLLNHRRMLFDIGEHPPPETTP